MNKHIFDNLIQINTKFTFIAHGNISYYPIWYIYINIHTHSFFLTIIIMHISHLSVYWPTTSTFAFKFQQMA